MEKPMRLESNLSARHSSHVFVMVLCIFWLFSNHGLAQTAEGYLMGTAVYTKGEASSELKFAANVNIELERNKSIFKIRSDDLGDFSATLSPGKYCLKAVKGENDSQLPISSSQHLCFKIRENKTLRFDIVLQENRE